MKNIKFRIWDKKNSVFGYPARGNQTTGEPIVKLGDRYILFKNDKIDLYDIDTEKYKDRFVILQYTGLQDTDGIDIYEGDIVEFYRIEECGKSCFGHYRKKVRERIIGVIAFKYGSFVIDRYLAFPFKDSLHDWLMDINNDCARLKTLYAESQTYDVYMEARYSDLRVIGNVFENPKLLIDTN